MASSKRLALFAPLHHREYALLWAGQSISWIGNIFYEVALLWFVLVLTGSTTAMAGIALVSTVPQLIFAPLAGVAADRFNRRILALTMDIGRAVVVLSIPLLSTLHHLSLVYIYIAAFLLWTCFTFFLPARTSLVANLVPEEELTAAMALMQTTMNVSWLLGAGVGGALVAAVGSIPALYLDALTFLASIGTLALIRSSGFKARPDEAPERSPLRAARDGWDYMVKNPALRSLIMMTLSTSLLIGPFIVLEAPFARLVLHTGALGFGILQSGFMAGSIMGTVVAGSLGQIRHIGLLIVAVIIGVGLFTVGYSFSTVLAEAVLFIALVGFLVGLITVPIQSLVQKRTPDEMRGRVNSAMSMANGAATPVSITVTGMLVAPFGVPAVYRMGGAGFLVLGIVSLFTSLARLRDEPAGRAEEADQAAAS